MPSGLVIPFAVEVSRVNPIRQSVRNLVINRGDDVTLVVTAYEDDGAPSDLTGASITVTIARMPDLDGSGWHGWWDYGAGWWTSRGSVVFRADGLITKPQSGQANVFIPGLQSACWEGRYGLMLTITSASGAVAVVSHGLLDVRGVSAGISLGPAAQINVGNGRLISGIGLRSMVFDVVAVAPAGRSATIYWQTFSNAGVPDGGLVWASAPDDYVESSGAATLVAGTITTQFSVPVRANDPNAKPCMFLVTLSPGNAAVLLNRSVRAVIPTFALVDFAWADFGSDFAGGS